MAYDYARLPPPGADAVRPRADNIRQICGPGPRTVGDVVAVGRNLAEAKAALPHGEFLPWINDEFDWSMRHAQRYIAAYAWLAKCDKLSHLAVSGSALFLLAAPATPDAAREAATRMMEGGASLTYSEACSLVAAHRPDTPALPPPGPPPPERPSGPFTYASLCSGIEGASVAWEGLGWVPLFFAEIDPYCRSLLGHRYPGVSLLGDIREITAASVERCEWTCSLPGRRASRSASRGCGRAWPTTVASLPMSSFASWASAALAGSSGKTSPAYCPRTGGELSLPSSGGWRNAGMGTPGGCWTLATSESPSAGAESSLWDVLDQTGEAPSPSCLTPQQLSNMAARLARYGKALEPDLAPLFGGGPATPPPSSAAT